MSYNDLYHIIGIVLSRVSQTFLQKDTKKERKSKSLQSPPFSIIVFDYAELHLSFIEANIHN